MKVSVSYLKNKNGAKEAIEELEKTTCDFIHVDLIDGIFAGEKNYEIEEVLSLFQRNRKPLDMHLMIENPSAEIEVFAILNPIYMSIPIEIPDATKYIEKIHGLGMKCGLSINPDTPIESAESVLEEIDLIIVMSVSPGYGGQKFIEHTVEKLKKLQEIKRENNYQFKISVDGGINKESVLKVKNYADFVVSGAYICMSEDMEHNIKELKNT